MKNPLIVYGAVAVVSFLILFTALFLVFRPKAHTPPKVAETEHTTEAPAESTLTVGDSLRAVPDSLRTTDNRETLEHLKQRVIDLYSGKSREKYSNPRTDSLLKALVHQIDSLESNQDKYRAYVAYQNKQVQTLRDSLSTARTNIATLESHIAGMKAQKQPGVPSIAAQKPVIAPNKGIQELAVTYNAMQPEKVAQLLSVMPDDQAIQILRKMSERKRAKVLEVMPLPKASSLVAKMVGA